MTIATILEAAVEVVTTMFGAVGTAVVTFITANPIVLLGCILFVMCALVGGITRLIPGVR